MNASATALVVVLAGAVAGEVQSIEQRGNGATAVILVGSTPWRVQLDPIDRREP